MSIVLHGFPRNFTASGTFAAGNGSDTFSVLWGAVGNMGGFPSITGVQRVGQTLTCVTTGLTGVSYQWKADGSNVGTNTSTYSGQAAGEVITCQVTSDQGTFTTAGLLIYTDMADASHNTTDNAVVALVPHNEATHVAINTGNWSSTSTWHNGAVPGVDCRVVVAHGVTVTYDVNRPDVRLDWVRVDGTLTASLTADTACLCETMVVTKGGSLIDGTAGNRVPAAYTHRWIFGNRNIKSNINASTDLDFANDATLVGRGLLAQGTWRVWAKNRTRWARVAVGQAPLATATTVTLESAPTGWEIGDELVIAGTKVNFAGGNADGSGSREDEEVTITGISGATITFTPALVYDHDNQFVTRADHVPVVLNRSSNVRFEQEGGTNNAPHARAHTMAMHMNAIMDLWDAGFYDLGRTDKNEYSGIIDAGVFRYYDKDLAGEQTATLTATSNLQSRYAVHGHHLGFGRAEANRPKVVNCHVENSPGWAYVHHAGDMDFIGCAAYKFRGAGMVAENANELGAWVRNAMVGTTADPTKRAVAFNSPKNAQDAGSGDFFNHGYGFAMRGRAMRVNNNVAASCSWGFVFWHRSSGFTPTLSPQRSVLDLYDLQRLSGSDTNGVDDAAVVNAIDYPIVHFADNEAFGAIGGLFVTKANPTQKHDFNVVLERFKAWVNGYSGGFDSVGAWVEYVGTYVLQDFDITGWNGTSSAGVHIGGNTMQISVVRPRVQNAQIGVEFDGATDTGAEHDDFSLDDPRYMLTENETWGVATPEASAVPGVATKTHEQVRVLNTTSPAPVTVTENVPFQIQTWDGGTFGTMTASLKTDTISTLGALPKTWDDIGQGGNTNTTSDTNAQHVLDTVGYSTNGGNNVILIPMHFADRLYGRPIKTMKALHYTGSVAGKTNNGAFTKAATGPSASDLLKTVSTNGTLTFNVVTDSSAALGTSSGPLVLDGEVKKPNHGTLTISGNSVTYTPDPDYVGPDDWYNFVYDSEGNYVTVKTDVLVGPGGTPAVFGTSDWSVADSATANAMDITLIAQPSTGGRRIRRVEYTTDAGTSWKRLTFHCPLTTMTITTESDGTALANGGYTVALRYVTDYDNTTTAASTGKAVTIS